MPSVAGNGGEGKWKGQTKIEPEAARWLNRHWNGPQYVNSTKLHDCTGTGTACSTVTAQITCLYRDGNCLQNGNSTTLYVCIGTATVCNTVTEQRYMFLQGL